MIFYEKNPDTNTLLELLEKDPIDRNQYIKTFIDLIAPCNQNTIFAIDGAWGSGKTIFIKQIDLLINYFNDFDEGESDIQPKEGKIITCANNLTGENISKLEELTASKQGIFSQIKESVQSQNINSIYFNAWEHDDETDPLLSIIFQLLSDYRNIDTSTILIDNLNIKEIIKLLSLGKIDITNLVTGKDLLDELHKKARIKDTISSIFQQLIEERCKKLIIFIDELDRCTPSYALKLLERIKHYITSDQIIVVFSTNILQLSHTVSAQYGSNFNSIEYLDKFFDLKISLPVPDPLLYSHFIKGSYRSFANLEIYTSVIDSFIKHTNLSLRQINRYHTYMNVLNDFMVSYNSSNLAGEIVKLVFLPYQIGLYCLDQSIHEEFIKGNEENRLEKYLLESDELIKKIQHFFVIDIGSHKNDFAYLKRSIVDILLVIYNYLFDINNLEIVYASKGITLSKELKYNVRDFDKVLNILS